MSVGRVYDLETSGRVTSDDIFHEFLLRRVDGTLGKKRIGTPSSASASEPSIERTRTFAIVVDVRLHE